MKFKYEITFKYLYQHKKIYFFTGPQWPYLTYRAIADVGICRWSAVAQVGESHIYRHNSLKWH